MSIREFLAKQDADFRAKNPEAPRLIQLRGQISVWASDGSRCWEEVYDVNPCRYTACRCLDCLSKLQEGTTR